MTKTRINPEEQQALILRSAAKIIEASSLLDFTMSAIAKEAGISIGSLYKHVQTKEDVLLALATEMFRNHAWRFQRAFALPLTTPERLIAVNLADNEMVGLYAFESNLELMVTNEAILERGSAGWLERMYQAERHSYDICLDLLAEAERRGELRCEGEPGACFDLIITGIWAMTVGFLHVNRQIGKLGNYRAGLTGAGPNAPEGPQVQAVKAFLNSFSWETPLSDAGIRKACDQLVEIGHRKPEG